MSYSYCKPELHTKYKGKSWYWEALGYLGARYHPVEQRILDTLRFVELAPKNATVFSYEFGSIIRDVGSTFGSVLDKMVRNTTAKSAKTYDIRDYRKFLVSEVNNIDSIAAWLNSPFPGAGLVLPFADIKNSKSKLKWWDAYNNLKHSEIDNYEDGCLSNAIYGMASLAILYTLMHPKRKAEGRLLRLIGFFEPLEEYGIFPK
jgi:hypothetical protein